jgi:hypothetical protein
MVGEHEGEEYPAGTVSETIVNNSTTTYSIYVNGTEVPGSRRTINIKDGLISLEAMITIASDNIPVELRWKVDKGSATLHNRIFSLSRFEY